MVLRGYRCLRPGQHEMMDYMLPNKVNVLEGRLGGVLRQTAGPLFKEPLALRYFVLPNISTRKQVKSTQPPALANLLPVQPATTSIPGFPVKKKMNWLFGAVPRTPRSVTNRPPSSIGQRRRER